MPWTYAQFVIHRKDLHISLQVGQIRNMMLEFLLLLLSIAIPDDIFR